MLPVAGIGAALVLLIAPAPRDSTVYVVWNASPSVPIGLYGIVHRRPEVGELALVRLPEDLAAGAVDRVCRLGADVFVQSRLIARAMTDSEPLPLWRGCRTLGGSELFLIAEHPGSFDSRYFGPLHAKHVIGTAVPIW